VTLPSKRGDAAVEQLPAMAGAIVFTSVVPVVWPGTQHAAKASKSRAGLGGGAPAGAATVPGSQSEAGLMAADQVWRERTEFPFSRQARP